RTGVTVGDIVNMLKGEERLICISIAEPSILRDIVVKLTESALGLRKREFTVKPQILFVFDEAQEFIPQYVSEDLRRCSHAVERLLRQGRKYGLGGAIATQRVAHLNTNVLQQLHTFFVGTLPRPYDRSVVSNSFQIDITMMDKTLEFPPGSWLLSSYVATGLDNVPLFIRADNVEEAIGAHLKQFRGASQ
ncbi:MAG: ATPase, partial [Candidatus Thorarchaeota archaeon]